MAESPVQIINIDEVMRGMTKAPELTRRFVRQAFSRGGKRVVKKVRKRLKAPPAPPGQLQTSLAGIHAPRHAASLTEQKIKKGTGLVRAFTKGRTVGSLALHAKVAKFPGFHEEATATTPGRLGFRRAWEEELPKIIQQSEKAAGRAHQVAIEREVKQTRALISKAGSLGSVFT